MRHLVIGQRQNAPNFSAFHWSPHGCLITIGQHFVTTRVVHLPKKTETISNSKSQVYMVRQFLWLLYMDINDRADAKSKSPDLKI